MKIYIILLLIILAGCSTVIQDPKEIIITVENTEKIERLQESLKIQISENAKLESLIAELQKIINSLKTKKETEYYFVVSGDCLWNISKEVYENPHRWREIYQNNKELIKDPNLIYTGQKFIIRKGQ